MSHSILLKFLTGSFRFHIQKSSENMVVSSNGATHGYPQNHPKFHGIFHDKPTIFGYHHFEYPLGK